MYVFGVLRKIGLGLFEFHLDIICRNAVELEDDNADVFTELKALALVSHAE